MYSQVPLIQRSQRGQEFEYTICPEGVFFLKSLKTKRLRIIFNITHQPKTLSKFNYWLLNQEDSKQQETEPTACLTITKRVKQISDDRVIVAMNAYECFEKEPFMVLLGYLGASLFIYHHFQNQPHIKSPLTSLLSKLSVLLSETDINELNSELSHSKGYAKNPFFLCLLSDKKAAAKFDQIYRFSEEYEQQNDEINKAIDTLIDFFPMRKPHSLQLTKADVSQIGKQFEDQLLGRTVFNFEFTGGTLENLCYDFCQIFNKGGKISLNECYLKIIQNQKARLEGQSLQHFMCQISRNFFFGTKIDLQGQNSFPLPPYELIKKYKNISEDVLRTSLQQAASCMTLNEFRAVQKNLRKCFSQKLSQLEEANASQANNLLSECYTLLDNVSQNEYNDDNLYSLFRQVQNKLELFASQCEVLTGGDQVQCLLWQYYKKLFEKYFSHLQNFTKEVVSDLIVQDQEQRVEIEELRYKIRLRENDLRSLQFEYQIQGDVLNETKCKLLCQTEDLPSSSSAYSFQANKLRKKLQELQEEVKDKALNISELEGILQKFDGNSREKDKGKYKFSREIQDLIKDVSQKVNLYYNVVKQAKEINELEEDLKAKFSKERAAIQQQRNCSKREMAKKEAEIQRLKAEKKQLEQIIETSKKSIETFKLTLLTNKESINSLERNCAQLNCVLAETEHELQYFGKGLFLAGQLYAKGGKADKLLKFCNTCTSDKLRDLLSPFVRK